MMKKFYLSFLVCLVSYLAGFGGMNCVFAGCCNGSLQPKTSLLSHNIEAFANGELDKITKDKESLLIVGKSSFIYKSESEFDEFSYEVCFDLQKYPESTESSALYEMVLSKPITTDRVRYICNDDYARVLELCLYEHGMPEYPDIITGDDSAGHMVNFAAGAQFTCSSYLGDFVPKYIADGVLSNKSRWVSHGTPPHELVIKLKEPKTIGCIQMVTGLMSGKEWKSVAKDFRFQYYSDGKWVDMPGVRSGDEPGSVGLIFGKSDKGYYSFVHNKASSELDIKYHFTDGKEQTLAHSDSCANLVEGSKAILGVRVLDGKINGYINGDLALTARMTRSVKGSVGIVSKSKANVINVESAKAEAIDERNYCCASNIKVVADGVELPLVFSPEHAFYEVQLPKKDLKKVVVLVEKAVGRQRVFIDGEVKSRKIFNAPQNSSRIIDVEVDSVAGKKSKYEIRVNPVPAGVDFELAFSDEFSDSDIEDDWYYRIGKRWNSVQSKDNVLVEDGCLKVKLTVDQKTGEHVTGGIISKELLGYGYYETRAKLWKGKGWHSAFWQMGYNLACKSDNSLKEDNQINEIDCFESTSSYGFSTNLHYYQPHKIVGAETKKADVASDFHVYAWEWTPTTVRFFFDNELIRESVYLPPHGLQNVWLSCVAHDNASEIDLPGEIAFDYFRYYKKDYGNTVKQKAKVLSSSDDCYFEKGNWQDGGYGISHDYRRNTRSSLAAGSEAGWKFNVGDDGLYDVYVWNPYVWPDGPITSWSYRIETGDEIRTVSYNPIKSGQKWISLGKYKFVSEESSKVSILVNGNNTVRVSSLMIVPCE